MSSIEPYTAHKENHGLSALLPCLFVVYVLVGSKIKRVERFVSSTVLTLILYRFLTGTSGYVSMCDDLYQLWHMLPVEVQAVLVSYCPVLLIAYLATSYLPYFSGTGTVVIMFVGAVAATWNTARYLGFQQSRLLK